MTTELTTHEQSDLEDLERIIQKALSSFVGVGNALGAINADRLYRITHSTFEEYCRDRWGLSSKRAYQLISASNVVCAIEGVTSEDLPVPANESVARALLSVTESDPPGGQVHAIETWRACVQSAPSNENGLVMITASHVRQTARQLQGDDEPETAPGTAPFPEPVSQPHAVDDLGNEVPARLAEAFDNSAALKSMVDSMGSIVASVQALEGGQGLQFVDSQEVETLFRRIREEIKFGIYHTICPRCGGLGVGPGTDCICRGAGFINRRIHATLTEDDAE